MEKIKIKGKWMELELDNCTLAMLKEEIAKRHHMTSNSMHLICRGKLLTDTEGDFTLTQMGIINNDHLLAITVDEDAIRSLRAEEERWRLKAAVEALAKRNVDGSLPVEDFNVELENQNGERVRFGSETDRQAMMMGLMFHAIAKRLMERKMFEDALEILIMGEDAFSLCDPEVIELIDNVAVLQLDVVWCFYMLMDIRRIAEARVRLEKAREGLERAHGKDFSRLNLLQPARSAYLQLNVRLELLEGVVAYHTNHFDNSRRALASAKAKLDKLQVAEDNLLHVMEMGFPERDAKRALRMSNQSVLFALELLGIERERRVKKREDSIQCYNEIMERKYYGLTPEDIERLNLPTRSETEERDVEMETLLYREIVGQNVLSDYDLELTEEAASIDHYLALLDFKK